MSNKYTNSREIEVQVAKILKQLHELDVKLKKFDISAWIDFKTPQAVCTKCGDGIQLSFQIGRSPNNNEQTR